MLIVILKFLAVIQFMRVKFLNLGFIEVLKSSVVTINFFLSVMSTKGIDRLEVSIEYLLYRSMPHMPP